MKSAVKFGLLGGGLLDILLFTGYSLNWYKTPFGSTIWTIVNFLILILAIFFGIKEVKKIKYPEGISYRNATLEGLKIIFITTILSSAFIYFYFITNQDQFNQFKKHTIENGIAAMKQAKYTEQDIKKNLDLVNTDFTAFSVAKENMRQMLLYGLLFTLAIASILRKKNDPMPEIKE